jgi:hypothetical protein
MKEIFGENMVFHNKAQITNKNNSTKVYNNVLVIREGNFNDFLNTIDGEEEIEEIKFKLKRKKTEGVKRYHSYIMKLDKKLNKLKGELIKHKPHFKTELFENLISNIPNNSKTKNTIVVKDYLKKLDLDKLCVLSTNPFFSVITVNISNILNNLTNKFSDYTSFQDVSKILKLRKIQDITQDGLCGYYVILSQLYDQYGGDTLGALNNDEDIMIKAKNDVYFLKEKYVKPYLQNLNINWEQSYYGETWDNYLNGWLPPKGIQGISNYIKRIIVLIYLNNNVVQMFFPNINNEYIRIKARKGMML